MNDATTDIAIDANAKKCITLYSAQSTLQTELITALLESKLDVACVSVSELSDIPSNTGLLLIDCLGRDSAQIRRLGKPVQDICQEHISAAVFNAEQSSYHEDLLDWPCVAGIFYTDTGTEQLLRGMEYLLDGDYWVPRKLLHHFFDKNRKAPSLAKNPNHINLTRRELQILTLIRDGATNLDISKVLEVSEHTIKTHLYNTYKKIGVRNRMEASNWAMSLSEKAKED